MASLSALSWTSSSMPSPASIAAEKAPRLFSTRSAPWRPRWANGLAINRASRSPRSFSPDGDDGIDFDGGASWQNGDADGAPGMTAGLTKNLLHQLRGAIGDQRLIGKI